MNMILRTGILIVLIVGIFFTAQASAKGRVIDRAVPFVSQAPLGNWKDPRQQNGCEEASVLMAVSWARGERLTKTKAERFITHISDTTKKKYGAWLDTSIEDTLAWIVKDYFKYTRVSLHTIASPEDLERLVAKGLVIAPVNGRTLKNPYFTAPGPLNHMLVIKGFDSNAKKFITNDPGTKRGGGFRYDYKTLSDSVRDYPTGDHSSAKMLVPKRVILLQQ